MPLGKMLLFEATFGQNPVVKKGRIRINYKCTEIDLDHKCFGFRKEGTEITLIQA